MPYNGSSSDVGGSHRRASAQASLHRDYLVSANSTQQTPPLRVLGLTKVTVVVDQITGVNTGSVDIFTVQNNWTNSVFQKFPARPWKSLVIGAIGSPEVYTFNPACRLVYLVINGPLVGASTWLVNIHPAG